MSAGVPSSSPHRQLTLRRRNRPLVAASRRGVPPGQPQPPLPAPPPAEATETGEGDAGSFVPAVFELDRPDPLLDVPLSTETFVPLALDLDRDRDLDPTAAADGGDHPGATPASAGGGAGPEPAPDVGTDGDHAEPAPVRGRAPVGVRVFEGPARLAVVDADVMTAIRLAIASANHEVLEASRAWAGFELVVSERADAVVVSQVLPDCDGLDLVRRFRDHPRTEHLPIVVLGRDDGDPAAALVAGADACLAKGAELADVIDVVGRLLGLTAEQRAHRRRAAPPADAADLAPARPGSSGRSWWRRQSA